MSISLPQRMIRPGVPVLARVLGGTEGASFRFRIHYRGTR